MAQHPTLPMRSRCATLLANLARCARIKEGSVKLLNPTLAGKAQFLAQAAYYAVVLLLVVCITSSIAPGLVACMIGG